jgi:hypothetical protein
MIMIGNFISSSETSLGSESSGDCRCAALSLLLIRNTSRTRKILSAAACPGGRSSGAPARGRDADAPRRFLSMSQQVHRPAPPLRRAMKLV